MDELKQNQKEISKRLKVNHNTIGPSLVEKQFIQNPYSNCQILLPKMWKLHRLRINIRESMTIRGFPPEQNFLSAVIVEIFTVNLNFWMVEC